MPAYMASVDPNDPGPAGGYTPYRRYWRWAEPDESYGVSGTPNNKYRPDNEGVDWPDAVTAHSSPKATTPATTTSSPRSTQAASMS